MTTAIEHPATVESQTDSIDTWLAVLTRFLDVSAAQRDAIRDEIDAHLRERVRDLMITGRSEPEAINTAISELGEVADLARRFSHASKSRTRRTIMNAAVLAFGAISVATATVFIGGPQPTRSNVAIYESTPPAKANPNSALDDKTAKVDFKADSLENVLRFLAASAGLDLVLDTHALAEQGVELDEEINLTLTKPQPVSQILKLVSEHSRQPFAWRVNGAMLEVATSSVFDRREIVLASFDVRNVLDLIWQTTNDGDAAAARLESLMMEYVEPDAWYSNGGNLGTLSIVGGKMFVKAPSRFHQPIQWILAQLEENAIDQASLPRMAPGMLYADSLRRYDPARPFPPGTGSATPAPMTSGGGATAPSPNSAFNPFTTTPGALPPVANPTADPYADPNTAPATTGPSRGRSSAAGGGAGRGSSPSPVQPPASKPDSDPGER